MNDFEDQLRAALQDRADRAEHAEDMSMAAIGRARTIQRRRAVVAAVTAAAVVAIAVPVAVYAGGTLKGDAPVAPPSTSGTPTSPATTVTPSNTPAPTKPGRQSTPPPSSAPTSESTRLPGPVQIKIDLTKLDRGEAPKVTYIDGNAIVVDGRRITIKVPNVRPLRAAAAGRGAAIIYGEDSNSLALLDAEGNEIRTFENATRLHSSRDESAIAFVVPAGTPVGPQKAGATLYHRDNSSGTLRSLRIPGAYDTRIHDVIGDRVYFSYETSPTDSDGGVLRRWVAGSSRSTQLTTIPWPTAVSVNAGLAATLRSMSDYGSCSALVVIGDGSERWRTCENQLVEFAPIGSSVLGIHAYGDGYAPTKIWVRDGSNGTVLREWSGVFPDYSFEDADTVLLVAEQDGRGAIVRCRISTGNCELATKVVAGTWDNGTGRYGLGS